MSRPGFTLEVDEKTPPLLTMAGAGLRMESFGRNIQVAYAAEPVASSSPVELIDSALAAPIDAEALAGQLRSDMKLTLVVLDNARPEPRMRFDVRRDIAERVLDQAAAASVGDVQIVIGTGLNRRWNQKDVKEILGSRIAGAFLPDELVTSHDITGDDLKTLGEVQGQPVRLNTRVADSDLVVVISVTNQAHPTHDLISHLGDVSTINRLHGINPDPAFAAEAAALVDANVPQLALSAVLGQPLLDSRLSFLNKREWEWGLRDQLALATARQFISALPKQGSQKLFGKPVADYRIERVVAGAPSSVDAQASAAWRQTNGVELAAPSDVLSVSVWSAMFDHGNPVGSPISAARDALVSQAGSHAEVPLVRDGGVVIARHPLGENFLSRTQSAAADLFATVLPETIDAREIAERYEPQATQDPWYLNLYRSTVAHHPLKTYHAWYRIQEAQSRLSGVIWVGGDRRSAALMGHRAATTFADALEIASNSVGNHPSVLHLHGPGRLYGVAK